MRYINYTYNPLQILIWTLSGLIYSEKKRYWKCMSLVGGGGGGCESAVELLWTGDDNARRRN